MSVVDAVRTHKEITNMYMTRMRDNDVIHGIKYTHVVCKVRWVGKKNFESFCATKMATCQIQCVSVSMCMNNVHEGCSTPFHCYSAQICATLKRETQLPPQNLSDCKQSAKHC